MIKHKLLALFQNYLVVTVLWFFANMFDWWSTDFSNEANPLLKLMGYYTFTTYKVVMALAVPLVLYYADKIDWIHKRGNITSILLVLTFSLIVIAIYNLNSVLIAKFIIQTFKI